TDAFTLPLFEVLARWRQECFQFLRFTVLVLILNLHPVDRVQKRLLQTERLQRLVGNDNILWVYRKIVDAFVCIVERFSCRGGLCNRSTTRASHCTGKSRLRTPF